MLENLTSKVMNLQNMICLIIYYSIIQHFPNSRYVPVLSYMRKLYICKILKIASYHPDSKFENNVYFSGSGKVRIGQNCQINEYVFIQGAEIGDNVMIAPHVSILCNIKDTRCTHIPMNKQGWIEKGVKVTIEDDVWIARNAILLPGVVVKKGSIVAAGAVVTKNFPAYSVLAGVPAKVVRNRLKYV